MPIERKLRLAAVGDLHCRAGPHGAFRNMVAAVNESGCDVLLLCGDLTDHGQPDEARRLVEVLQPVKAPKVAVLGNHDLESGRGEEVKAILGSGGVVVLDGDHYEFAGGAAGIAGVKGFCGGFDRDTLQAFGEPATKAFVHESVQEALKLEAALGQIDAPVKIALLHYAPIRATCEGERPEIVPFLGSSRLAEPLGLHRATMAFHGHAHHGRIEGRTISGVPVYNVALPLLRRVDPERRIFVVEVDVPEDAPQLAPHPGAVVTLNQLGPSAPSADGRSGS